MRPRGQLGLGASLCGARRLSGVRSSPPGRDRSGGAPLPERGPLGAVPETAAASQLRGTGARPARWRREAGREAPGSPESPDGVRLAGTRGFLAAPADLGAVPGSASAWPSRSGEGAGRELSESSAGGNLCILTRGATCCQAAAQRMAKRRALWIPAAARS